MAQVIALLIYFIAIFFVETGINDDITAFAKDYDDKKILAEAERMFEE